MSCCQPAVISDPAPCPARLGRCGAPQGVPVGCMTQAPPSCAQATSCVGVPCGETGSPVCTMLCTREIPPGLSSVKPNTRCFQYETAYQGNVGNDMGVPTVGYRSARYNQPEWLEGQYAQQYQSFADRDNAERVRMTAADVRAESGALARRAQDLTTKRLTERLNDIHFWRNELEREILDMSKETDCLLIQKRRLERALAATETALHIVTDNLNCRERRESMDLTQDCVELNLLKELDVINNVRDLLKKTIQEAEKQIRLNRDRKEELESDWSDKKEADELDTFCVALRNENTNKQFHPAAATFQPVQSTPESWAQKSHDNVTRAEHERMASIQLRTLIDNVLQDTSRDELEQMDASNQAFMRRTEQMDDTLCKLKETLVKTVQDIDLTEKEIRSLRDHLKDHENFIKVAQTRLNTRQNRPGVDLCRDPPQYHLVGEAHELSRSSDSLLQKLNEAEHALKDLQDQRQALEREISYKQNSLFIDRQKCMNHRTRYPSQCHFLGYK